MVSLVEKVLVGLQLGSQLGVKGPNLVRNLVFGLQVGIDSNNSSYTTHPYFIHWVFWFGQFVFCIFYLSMVVVFCNSHSGTVRQPNSFLFGGSTHSFLVISGTAVTGLFAEYNISATILGKLGPTDPRSRKKKRHWKRHWKKRLGF